MAAERATVLVDLAFFKPALAKNDWRQEKATAKQHWVDDEHFMAPVMLPNPVDAAIWHIQAARLGNPFGIPPNSAIILILDLLDSGIFHRNFIFPIVKCVPANSELVFSGSESSPTIDCSNFMNRKTFPL